MTTRRGWFGLVVGAVVLAAKRVPVQAVWRPPDRSLAWARSLGDVSDQYRWTRAS